MSIETPDRELDFVDVFVSPRFFLARVAQRDVAFSGKALVFCVGRWHRAQRNFKMT